jgi:hypothetical protein
MESLWGALAYIPYMWFSPEIGGDDPSSADVERGLISSGHTKVTTDSGFRRSETEMPRFLRPEAHFLGFFGAGHSHDARKKAYSQSRTLIRSFMRWKGARGVP